MVVKAGLRSKFAVNLPVPGQRVTGGGGGELHGVAALIGLLHPPQGRLRSARQRDLETTAGSVVSAGHLPCSRPLKPSFQKSRGKSYASHLPRKAERRTAARFQPADTVQCCGYL